MSLRQINSLPGAEYDSRAEALASSDGILRTEPLAPSPDNRPAKAWAQPVLRPMPSNRLRIVRPNEYHLTWFTFQDNGPWRGVRDRVRYYATEVDRY